MTIRPIVECESTEGIDGKTLCNPEREMHVGIQDRSGLAIIAEYISDIWSNPEMVGECILEIDISEATAVICSEASHQS